MSIITDALKKAELEKQLKKNQGKTFSSVAPEEIPAALKEFSAPSEKPLLKPYVPSASKPAAFSVRLFLTLSVILMLLIAAFYLLGQSVVRRHSVVIIPPAGEEENKNIKVSTGGVEFSLSAAVEKPQVAEEPEEKSPVPDVPPISIMNPFEKIVGDVAPRFVLTGLINDPGKPAAIINNEVVEAGQTIRDARVVRISAEGVVLEHKGREINLTL